MPRRTSSDHLILGADVVRRLTPIYHPLIMVDRVTRYAAAHHRDDPAPSAYRSTASLQKSAGRPRLTAEKFVSANEPVFVGHFPDLKIWPGIHTIEGLRQCCSILQTLQELDEKDLIDDLLRLENRRLDSPAISDELADVLDGVRHAEHLPMKLRVKLLAPVFAGSVIEYRVSGDEGAWNVRAEVEGQLVAKGEIVCRSPAG